MRNVFYLSVIILSSVFSYGQSTWVRTPNLDNLLPAFNYDSTTVGPLEMCLTPNGLLITLMQMDQNHGTSLIAWDSSGNIIWQKPVANHGTIYQQNCFSLRPTIDNGCIYVFQHVGSYISGSVIRLDSNGSIVWQKTYTSSFGQTHDIPLNVTITKYNSSYVQYYSDSLVEFDSLGNYMRHLIPFSRTAQLAHLTDSDFIKSDSNRVSKESFFGTQRWSIVANNPIIVSADSSITYVRASGLVKKIDTDSGDVIWSKPIPSSAMSMTNDLGLISISGITLSKYDSSGTLEWSKTINLPHYNLKCINQLSDGGYVTGGCWRNHDLYYSFYFGYSPLLIKVDSMGNGVSDSTHYFYNGNANDNNTLSFADDAVYVAAAINQSGPARDSLLQNIFIGFTCFSTEWPDGFGSGINYKYSDLNGNGHVDSLDIVKLVSGHYPYPALPHWQRLPSLPEVKFLFEKDTVSFPDTIKINVILGSTTMPVDSIYGLSFDLSLSSCSFPFPGVTGHSHTPISALGDTSMNLLSYHYLLNPQGLPYISSMVLCRTDHTNAYVNGDTIAQLSYFIPQNTMCMTPLVTNVELNAITVDGSTVPLSIINDTVYVSGTTEINKVSIPDFNILPNPARNKLLISFNGNISEIIIYDGLGNVAFELRNFEEHNMIDISGFSNGVYYLHAIINGNLIRRKVIILK